MDFFLTKNQILSRNIPDKEPFSASAKIVLLIEREYKT